MCVDMEKECIQNKRHYDLSMSKRTRKPSKVEGAADMLPISAAASTTENLPTVLESLKIYGTDPEPTNAASSKTENPISDIEGTDPHCLTSVSSKTGILPQEADKEEAIDHRSLKQLINGDGRKKHGRGKRGGNSLGHHFTEEEKQLQLVTKQQAEGAEGVKLSGMVSRCMKILSHLIKVNKRDPRLVSRKKPLHRLAM